MPSNKLNVKQENFVQNIVKGMSQRQAYKEAYQVNYSDEAIDSKASVLFNTDKVQIRYKELIGELESNTIMTAKERMEWLTKIVKEEIKEKTAYIKNDEVVEKEIPTKLDTKIKALDTLNKMSGEYITKFKGEIDNPKATKILSSINRQLGDKSE